MRENSYNIILGRELKAQYLNTVPKSYPCPSTLIFVLLHI